MSTETAAAYRRKLTIDHSRVFNADQRDFPVLVRLSDPTLRSTSAGGHVAHDQAADLFFTRADGTARLAHEVVAYDADQGRLEAWVKVPELSCREDVVLYLYCGGAAAEAQEGKVWDDGYGLVQHGMEPAVAGSDDMELGQELTVEAWVQGTVGAEVLQPLVSKWAVLESFDTFSAYDAGNTDGLNSIGYLGGAFDGRYVYWPPNRRTNKRESVHGVVLRCDTHGDFHKPQSWQAYDVENIRELRTVNYYGAVFDGTYVYFVPQDEGTAYHSRVLRYDTRMDFKSAVSWEVYDVGLTHSYQGVAFDGKYVYFCPGYEGAPGATLDLEDKDSGSVVRLDTGGEFKDPASWRIFDVKGIAQGASCFDGGAFDGRYIYFVPLKNGVVLQYDTRGDFADEASWRACDVRRFIGDGWFVGAVFDGRYLYLMPYMHGIVVRCDTHGDFAADSSWESYDSNDTGGLDTSGADGGFFDGRYVYFIPWAGRLKGKGSGHHANFLRYDTRGPFTAPASWEACDASRTDGLQTIGYNGGVFDGRFIYTSPLCDDDAFHGRVLRCDTVGEEGSFSLRYCDYGHNGGLCAAVPGPSFLVNTKRGPLSVAAHQALTSGWHHLAGVYNGRTLKLLVDGRVVAERSGSGALERNEVEVTIGRLANGAAQFRGQVEGVRVAKVARSDDWLKTTYQNLVDPSAFVRSGDEEEVG